jgi:hypothetical protein
VPVTVVLIDPVSMMAAAALLAQCRAVHSVGPVLADPPAPPALVPRDPLLAPAALLRRIDEPRGK